MEEGDPAGVVLRAERVTRRYGQVLALDAVSLDVRRAECVALIGESGTVALTLRTVGPGVYGEPAVTTMAGTWRPLSGGRLEIKPTRGRTVIWTVTQGRLRIRGRSRNGEPESRAPMTFDFTRVDDSEAS